MDPRHILMPLLLFGLALPRFALAQAPTPATPLSATAKAEVIETLGRRLQSIYVFPDVADRASAGLAAKSADGGYATAGTSSAFANALSDDLRALGNDRHLGVLFDPDLVVHDESRTTRSPAAVAMEREETLREGFGIARVERLPGNVGYIDVRGFGPTEFVGDAYEAALSLLAGTDALILDLRRNGGGEPASVAHLMSHFFPEGDARHLNDIYYREGDETRQFWTSAAVRLRYAKPVYVLISGFTFSGGEECAYDFQTQKRGTLVGEITGGGANPGELVALGHGFVAFIPNGRAINPVTHTNWEHAGVKPDVPVAAAEAEQTAYAQILRTLIAKATDPAARDELRTILARVEKGESEQVSYAPPH